MVLPGNCGSASYPGPILRAVCCRIRSISAGVSDGLAWASTPMMPTMFGVAIDVPEMVPYHGCHSVSAALSSPPVQIACVGVAWAQVDVDRSPGAAMSGYSDGLPCLPRLENDDSGASSAPVPWSL